jgi:hypothetical protein
LLRWTIGPVSERGLTMLSISIRSFRRLYGDTFDLCIQHNGLDNAQLLKVKRNNVPLFKQFHSQDVEYAPEGCKWKLYPPRMRQDSHEIVMDNDLIIHKRLPQIDAFLAADNTCIITEAIKRCYGRYDPLIPEGICYNVGLYGMPPGYDLSRHVRDVQKGEAPRRWQTYFDDQGLVTACFQRHSGPVTVIPRSMVSISLHEEVMPEGTHGVHFVGGNGVQRHLGWDRYNKFRMKLR